MQNLTEVGGAASACIANLMNQQMSCVLSYLAKPLGVACVFLIMLCSDL